MASERLVCETAKSSRHLRIVEPGLLERMISPAILRAKTSLRLGDTDISDSFYLHSSLSLEYKTVPFFQLNNEN